jgi:hypothetical protein
MASILKEITLGRAALIAGIGYLVAIFVTPFGWIDPLIVIGDAPATFHNIASHEFLFRLAIAAWLVVIVADTVVAWALYYFFRPVSNNLSLLAAWLRIIFVPVMAVAFLQWLGALQLIQGANHHAGDALRSLQDQAMFFFVSYDYAVNIAFMLFGLHVGLIGYLAFKSGYVPRILGVLLIIACIGYQIDTFGSILFQSYAANPLGFLVTVAAPAFLAELSFTVWLLIRGSTIKEIE